MAAVRRFVSAPLHRCAAAAAVTRHMHVRGTTAAAPAASLPCQGAASLVVTSRRFAPAVIKPGDWNCPSCGEHNFRARSQCYRCGGVKPYSSGDAAGGEVERAGSKQILAGDWTCQACGSNNFRRRTACYQCGQRNPNSDAATTPSQDSDVKPRPGDWKCVGCTALNFRSRSVCFRCGDDKPLSASDGEPLGARKGDWVCEACKEHNYASRGACHSCGAEKPTSPEFIMSGGGGGEMKEWPGDWKCSQCGLVNFARRGVCHKCAAPKDNVAVTEAEE